MRNRIRIARGTKADLQSVTKDIPAGVPIYTTDENKLYIGQEGKKGNELEAINAKHADSATNATNAILNSDGSYSGFTKDVSNKIIKTTDNLIISCKYLVAHSDSFTNELNLSESWVDNATYELKYMINGSIRFIKFIYNPTACPGVIVDQSFYVATSSGKKGFNLYTYEVDWSSNPNKLSVFSFSNCTEVLVPETGSGTATGSQQNFTNNILLALYSIIE